MRKIFVIAILLFTVEAYALPSRYDLRDYGRITSVKNQGIPGPCWAFAAMGALESSWLTQYPGKAPDLSDLHTAFYCYKDPDKKRNFSSRFKSGTLRLEGNAFMPVALLARLSGPTDEKNLRYTSSLSNAQIKSLSKKSPETFRRSMRLKAAYFLSGTSVLDRENMKRLIMDCGALVVSMYSDPSNYHTMGNYYTYYDNSHGTDTNHIVLIAGWDDNFSRYNFSPKPNHDGAWLIKNSWGTSRGSNGGYFWMSYDQHIYGGTAFIAERNNPRLKHYGYDDLGYCGNAKYTWGANVFRISGKGERLKEVGFYTPLNGTEYEIYVYSHGSKKPSSPLAGRIIASLKGREEFAGYHTENLTEQIRVNEGEYFSVVLKLSVGYMPVEMKYKDYSENAEINPGESYFSHDGQNWTDGFNIGNNACIKAFTVTR
ncbi:MAG: hypothetical protein II877_09000 [Synergistaceae bacterium]|nr:hypothetical protein [Synergistaceae bacterium]